MSHAIGLIETSGLIGAIVSADAMVKTANVHIIGKEKISGGLVTVKIIGESAAVKLAVNAGAEAARKTGQLISSHIIPQPDIESVTVMPKLEDTAGILPAELPVTPTVNYSMNEIVDKLNAAILTDDISEADIKNEYTPISDLDNNIESIEPEQHSEAPLDTSTLTDTQIIDEADSTNQFIEAFIASHDEILESDKKTNLDDELSDDIEITDDLPDEKINEPVPASRIDGDPVDSENLFVPDSIVAAPQIVNVEIEANTPPENDNSNLLNGEYLIQESFFGELSLFETDETSINDDSEVDYTIADLHQDVFEVEDEEAASTAEYPIEEDYDDTYISLDVPETGSKEETETSEISMDSNASSDKIEATTIDPEEEVIKLMQRDITTLNVHQLRRVARHTPDFPIGGRDISKSGRQELIYYFELLRNGTDRTI